MSLLDTIADSAEQETSIGGGSSITIPNDLRVQLWQLMVRQLDSNHYTVSTSTIRKNDGFYYCAALEQQLFVVYGDHGDLYQRKASQLVYNLSINSKYLLSTYTPEQLLCLDDNLLAKGTHVEQKQKEYFQKVEQCRDALDITGLFAEYEKDVAMEVCPKCRGSKLTYSAVQDRSADEGQTVHFSCLNVDCKHKWRVRT